MASIHVATWLIVLGTIACREGVSGRVLAAADPREGVVYLAHTQKLAPALNSNATLAAYNTNASVPVIFYAPAAGVEAKGALVVEVGFSVDIEGYTDLAERLAKLGYFVALPNYRRGFGFPMPPNSGLPRPGCRPDFSLPSVSMVETMATEGLSNPRNASQAQALFKEFQEVVKAKGIIPLGHSAGGRAVINLLLEPESSLCTLTGSGAYISGLMRTLCDGYVSNTSSSMPYIPGMIIYEGYGSGPTLFGTEPQTLILRNNSFLIYLGGQNDTFLSTFIGSTFKTAAGQMACKGFVSFEANHFGINNFYEGVNNTQRSPCSQVVPSNYTTTKAKQEAVLDRIAEAIDLTITTATQPSSDAENSPTMQRWASLLKKPYVVNGSLDNACFKGASTGNATGTGNSTSSGNGSTNSTSPSPSGSASAGVRGTALSWRVHALQLCLSLLTVWLVPFTGTW